MDVLSEVLRAVRLRGAMYFEVDAAHPWISMNPSMDEIGEAMMPSAEHVIPFHVMVRGQAWVMPQDRSVPPAVFAEGDILMFPYGNSHIITSDREKWEGDPPDLNFYRRVAREKDRPFTLVAIGGERASAKFVCGYLGCDASPFNPLLAALPTMLLIHAGVGDNPLLRELLRAAVREGNDDRVGTETVLAKLSELMFVDAIRRHMDSVTEEGENWLLALKDHHVGVALRAMHSDPARAWTLDALAREAGLSRSGFAERFVCYTGETPMNYLAQWRMQLAASLLKDGLTIGSIAGRVGYRSEAAFQRAFKKHVGVTPGRWRKLA